MFEAQHTSTEISHWWGGGQHQHHHLETLATCTRNKTIRNHVTLHGAVCCCAKKQLKTAPRAGPADGTRMFVVVVMAAGGALKKQHKPQRAFVCDGAMEQASAPAGNK